MKIVKLHAVGCLIAALLCGFAHAQPGAKTQNGNKNPAAKRYFIEFRARAALSYGHTFAVIGKVGQKITTANIVGLHPFTESSIPWTIGHLVPVPSETGFSDGDVEEQYTIARYRILLTEAQYRELMTYTTELKARSPLWHAAIYNCNAFVGDIARHLGLRAPANFWMFPKDFINELKDLNNGVKILPGPIPSSAREQSAANISSVQQ